MLNYRNFIASLLCLTSSLLVAQEEVDSLLNVIRTTPDTVRKIDAMNELAYALRMSNPDSTILLTKQTERLAQQYNYPLGEADAKMRRGIANTAFGNYYQALQEFLDALSKYEVLKAKDKIAGTLNNIGRIYNFIGDTDKALRYYQSSATQYAELRNYEREGSIVNNIGYIHKLNGNYEEAISYLHISLDRANQPNGALRNKLYPIYNLGSVFMHLNQPDSSLPYLFRAEEIAKTIRDQYILSLTHIDIGLMYRKLNKPDEAEGYFTQAYEGASSVGMRAEQRDAAFNLSQLHEAAGDYEKALQYHQKYKAMNDSLINNDLTRRIAFQEAEYEYNQQRVREEAERRKNEIESERALANAIWVRNTLIAGLLVMVLVTYLIYLNFMRKRKANDALRKLNAQIEQQTEELKRANLEITVMNSNLETVVNRRTAELKRRNKQLKDYLSSNSHIVRAPLARILGLVDLYEPGDAENLDFINESLHKSATELDNALRDINKKLSDADEN